ncbi:unnamed protein product [Caenorhabditis nigoni]
MSSLASHVALWRSGFQMKTFSRAANPMRIDSGWGIQNGMAEEGTRGSQKLPQAVSRLPTWKALRNQHLRMMHMDDTPFGQKEFEVLRKSMKMEHEEQIAKGWIVRDVTWPHAEATAWGQANESASTFPEHQCHFWSINANVDNIYVDVGWIWRFIAILNKVDC